MITNETKLLAFRTLIFVLISIGLIMTLYTSNYFIQKNSMVVPLLSLFGLSGQFIYIHFSEFKVQPPQAKEKGKSNSQ